MEEMDRIRDAANALVEACQVEREEEEKRHAARLAEIEAAEESALRILDSAPQASPPQVPAEPEPETSSAEEPEDLPPVSEEAERAQDSKVEPEGDDWVTELQAAVIARYEERTDGWEKAKELPDFRDHDGVQLQTYGRVLQGIEMNTDTDELAEQLVEEIIALEDKALGEAPPGARRFVLKGQAAPFVFRRPEGGVKVRHQFAAGVQTKGEDPPPRRREAPAGGRSTKRSTKQQEEAKALRESIVKFVLDNPGCSQDDIADGLKLQKSTVRRQVQNLARNNKIRAAGSTKARRYFHANAPLTQEPKPKPEDGAEAKAPPNNGRPGPKTEIEREVVELLKDGPRNLGGLGVKLKMTEKKLTPILSGLVVRGVLTRKKVPTSAQPMFELVA